MCRWVKAFRKRFVALAELEPSMGVIEQHPTKPDPDAPLVEDHYNWWTPVGFDPVPLFTVVTT
jgi:hypothetical protein